jgi:hypothetical protein
MTEPYRVFVVVDRDFGQRLAELAQTGPVWTWTPQPIVVTVNGAASNGSTYTAFPRPPSQHLAITRPSGLYFHLYKICCLRRPWLTNLATVSSFHNSPTHNVQRILGSLTRRIAILACPYHHQHHAAFFCCAKTDSLISPDSPLLRWRHLAGRRSKSWAANHKGDTRATQGQARLPFVLSENNALLFAPRIVFRFC